MRKVDAPQAVVNAVQRRVGGIVDADRACRVKSLPGADAVGRRAAYEVESLLLKIKRQQPLILPRVEHLVEEVEAVVGSLGRRGFSLRKLPDRPQCAVDYIACRCHYFPTIGGGPMDHRG